jgi:hypothetical protein
VALRDRHQLARDGSPGVVHAFVQSPGGICYDADGRKDRAGIIADTCAAAPSFHVLGGRDGLAPFVGNFGHLAEFCDEDVEAARRAVDLLVLEHSLHELEGPADPAPLRPPCGDGAWRR